MAHPAVFLDRDGTIVERVEFLSDPAQLRVLPRAADGIRLLNERGFLAVVITNQPVVARGLCTLADVEHIHNVLQDRLRDAGAHIDVFYFCPHLPPGSFPDQLPEFTFACQCRKPGTDLVLRAASELDIDLPSSFFVGDSVRDVQCARAAECTPLGVRTGTGLRDLGSVPAPQILDDLFAAAEWIVRR